MKKHHAYLPSLATAALLAAAGQAVAANAAPAPLLVLDRPPFVYCNHEPCPGPDADTSSEPRFHILRGMGRGMSQLSQNLESGDMTAASANLESLFAGGSMDAAAPVVAAAAPRKRAARSGAENPVVLAGWKGCVGGYLAGGAGGCGIGSAAEDGFNAGMDSLGDYLRDRNDDKLKP